MTSGGLRARLVSRAQRGVPRTLCGLLVLSLMGSSTSAVLAASSPASTTEVLDAANLVVALEDGSSQRVRLAGVSQSGSAGPVCGSDAALARARELLADQTVTVEVSDDASAVDETGSTPGTVRLADGRSLAEVLVREGLVMRAGGDDGLAGAQAAAITDGVGIWAPGVCNQAAGPAERARLAGYVLKANEAVSQARLATSVLADQALSAPLQVNSPNWQSTTARAASWARQASAGLEASPDGQPALTGIALELASLDARLQAQAAAFDNASHGGGAPEDLSATAQDLHDLLNGFASAANELNAVILAYGLGD